MNKSAIKSIVELAIDSIIGDIQTIKSDIESTEDVPTSAELNNIASGLRSITNTASAIEDMLNTAEYARAKNAIDRFGTKLKKKLNNSERSGDDET